MSSILHFSIILVFPFLTVRVGQQTYPAKCVKSLTYTSSVLLILPPDDYNPNAAYYIYFNLYFVIILNRLCRPVYCCNTFHVTCSTCRDKCKVLFSPFSSHKPVWLVNFVKYSKALTLFGDLLSNAVLHLISPFLFEDFLICFCKQCATYACNKRDTLLVIILYLSYTPLLFSVTSSTIISTWMGPPNNLQWKRRKQDSELLPRTDIA